MRTVSRPVAVVLLLGLLGAAPQPATGQDLSALVPAPVDHPAYPQVKALMEREQRCDAEVGPRREALKGAERERRFFLTDQERADYVAQFRRPLDDAIACQRDSLKELLGVALPQLEADCVKSETRPCAQWARNQRLWRIEVESLESRVRSCSRDRDRVTADLQRRAGSLSGSSYTDPGVRTYEQQTRDLNLLQQHVQQRMAEARAQEVECVGNYRAKIEYLKMALAGRDPAAEARAEARAQLRELMLATQTLVGKLGPELTFDSFHESLSKLTGAIQQATTRPPASAGAADALRMVTSVADALTASGNAWSRERAGQVNVEKLTRERDAARAVYAQRSSLTSQVGLDVAEENLQRAIQDLDRAKQDRAAAWRTAERLMKEAPRLAGDNPGSESVRPR